jgi:hypothetical protein
MHIHRDTPNGASGIDSQRQQRLWALALRLKARDELRNTKKRCYFHPLTPCENRSAMNEILKSIANEIAGVSAVESKPAI